MNVDGLKETIRAAVDARRAELIETSLEIHAHPELAYQEHRAAALLSGLLERAGFDVERGVGGLPTAFRASYGNPSGPTIAILAEYDALPGVGHACGHNVIGTSAVAAGIALRAAWPDLPGRVLVVGTPAEEAGGGKIDLAKAGVFQDVDAALMVHPSNKTRVEAHALAMTEVKVAYHGKAAHASSKPWEGINALDALVIAYSGIAALRQHIRADARIHGIITNGGAAPNIVPDYAAGHFYVRAADDAYVDALLEKVAGCFRAGAEATGARLEWHVDGPRYSAVKNNPTLVALFRANLNALGVEETPPDPTTAMGSTDMGNVSQLVPAIHPSLAIAPSEVPGHSVEFAARAASEDGHRGLLLAAKAMAMTVADLLSDPAQLASAKQQFSTP